jgi:hypothetical protein
LHIQPTMLTLFQKHSTSLVYQFILPNNEI